MSDQTGPSVSRRGFLRATAGGVAASTGTAAAAEGGGGGGGEASVKPDFGSWLEGVDGGYTDARGQDEVTVQVGASGNGGNLAFEPAGVWVDQGATVVWEWTGQGGGHNVHATTGASFSSGDPVADEGETFTHTFDSGGIAEYQCDPHASLGMKGAVAVGGGVPTVETGGYESTLPDSAKTAAVASVGGVVSVLGLAYFFLKYGGDYGDTVE